MRKEKLVNGEIGIPNEQSYCRSRRLKLRIEQLRKKLKCATPPPVMKSLTVTVRGLGVRET